MLATLRRYPLVLFFVLAYAFTWARWLPEAAAARGWIEFETPFWLMLLGGYGPLLSAVLLTALVSGKAGLKDLGARLVRWRVKPRWYLVVLLTPLFFQLVGLLLYSLVSGRPFALAPNPLPWLELLTFSPLSLGVRRARRRGGLARLCPARSARPPLPSSIQCHPGDPMGCLAFSLCPRPWRFSLEHAPLPGGRQYGRPVYPSHLDLCPCARQHFYRHPVSRLEQYTHLDPQ